MIALILFLLSFPTFAEEPLSWSYATGLQDKHEFYQNNEVITLPKDAWQVLFSVSYIDGKLNKLKDCIYYKVPGEGTGILKVKTAMFTDDCDKFIFGPGDREVLNIKSLQYSLSDKKAEINFTDTNFKSGKWSVELLSSVGNSKPEMHSSSAEYKAPKIILLAPEVQLPAKAEPLLEDGTLCHDVNEDCEIKSQSTCTQCRQGWYELPNGCKVGPKYCGILKCGLKGQPACRRGVEWQRSEQNFDCRTNSSFAYCATGLTLVCEGRKAFCR